MAGNPAPCGVNALGRVVACGAALAGLLAAATPARAQSLDAWAGAFGGAGVNGFPFGCNRGPTPELTFFSFNPQTPTPSLAACGISGSLKQATGSTGPLVLADSLAPVSLGAAAGSGTFDGSAQAGASYGRLGAAAHAHIGAGRPQSSGAVYDSVAASRFSDRLTAASPSVVNASAGFVRYQFSVDGSVSALGAPEAFFFGETYMVLDVQQQGGSIREVMNAHVRRGDLGVISGNPAPAGWVTSSGSLSGASTFFSADLPMSWGLPWDVRVGLLAWAYGTADSNFLSSARLTGLALFDTNHNPVSNFSLVSVSGTDYINAVPEPTSNGLLLAGLMGLMVWAKAAVRPPTTPAGAGTPPHR